MTSTPTPEAVVRSILAATDAQDFATLAELLTEDVHMTFGSAETTAGQAALFGGGTELETLMQAVTGMRHEIHRLWTVDENIVVTEMTVHYERRDGNVVSLPCANTFRLRDGRVHDYRIYMDIAPVLA